MGAWLLLGLSHIWGALAVFGEPPPPALRCPLLDQRGSPSPRGALLRFLGGPEAPPHPETPRDPQNTFDVIDSLGVLQDFWGPSREPPRCELSPTVPLLPPPPGPSPRCHPGLGTRWWLLALGTAHREGTVLLHEGTGDPPRVNASLAISTLTPTLRGLLGTPQTLHCSFTPPWLGVPFALEWLWHRDGVTRRLLAFDSATNRVTEAAPGVLLLLGGHGDTPWSAGGTQPSGGALEVSLQLPPLSVSDDGSFVCSVATPLGQLQQVLRMNVIAPPQVSLLPSQLSPGVPAQLRCDAVGFFPLDVGIRWERQARGDPRPLPVTPEGATAPGDTGTGLSWSSGHRRAADGTFSRSAGLSVGKGTAGDSYSCLVTHAAWDVPLRVTVHVTGDTGPSVEDMAGMALVAFVIGGLCQRLWPSAGR
ncbi:tapasin-like [Molothrus aeneus]|uniref:tapasin-like n=1 Tax=Molothrus aeneus TaxID=84833 RepID=UPI003458A03A